MHFQGLHTPPVRQFSFNIEAVTSKVSCTSICKETLQPVLDPARVFQVFSMPIPIVNQEGMLLTKIGLKQFLFNLINELYSIIIPTSPRLEAIGGAVAYMIGSKAAAEYASEHNIKNPHLSDFDRYQDLDLAVDLTGNPDAILYQ